MLAKVKDFFNKASVDTQALYPGYLLGDSQREMLHKHRFTPDHLDIYMKFWHNIFIYNECQKGQSKFGELGYYNTDQKIYNGWTEVKKLASGFTSTDNWVMMKKFLGKETFPFAMEIPENMRLGGIKGSFIGPIAPISGQLFSIRAHRIVDLDNYMLNTVRFERKRVIIDVPFRIRDRSIGKQFDKRFVSKIPAYMYVAKQSFWLPEIKEGQHSLVRMYEANSGKEGFCRSYYYFFNEQIENRI